jgi:isoquinoline 1-oxidoreductase beta subunit
MLHLSAHSGGDQGGMTSAAPISEHALPEVSRRRFLAAGALLVGFVYPRPAPAAAEPDLEALGVMDAAATGFDGFAPDGFIRIGSDGRIILVVPSVEMGQGIATGEAMMLAEELEVDLDQVEVEMAPPDMAAYNQSILKAQATGGSTSVRAFFDPLRKAGAVARTMLVGAAAQRWGVPDDQCQVTRGVVRHPLSGRSASFGALAEAARRQPAPVTVALKSPSRFRLIGKPLRRVDTPGKVNGSARYGIDADVEEMRFAAVAMAPSLGATVQSVRDQATRAVTGVIDVLQIEDAVAVTGTTYWAARKGLDLLEIAWAEGPFAGLDSAALANALVAAKGAPISGGLAGDPDQALGTARRRIDAVYDLPYLAHATLEPINTTIHVRPDGCDIWVGTQVPEIARTVTAGILGMAPEKVMVRNHLIGGGFGRRLAVDTIEQAARFGRQVAYPLKIIWTREQDIQHDRFRPAYHDQISAGLDADGLPTVVAHRTTCSTVRPYYDRKPWPEGKLDPDAVAGAAKLPYAIPHSRSEWLRQDGPIALNWWRGVGETHNVFVVESFIDELSHAAGRDPVAYRRALLKNNPRSLAVLDTAAEASGWGGPLPPRCGRGVSLHDSFMTHAALVIEVEVDEQGEIRLRRATAAVDCGIVVNPNSVVAQMEGGVLFGLSAALFNAITFANGAVEQSNFNDYRQLRMSEAPPIEVRLVASDEPPGGLGEVGTVSAAPALGNAIFAATGIRLRSLPFARRLLAEPGSDARIPVAGAVAAGVVAGAVALRALER